MFSSYIHDMVGLLLRELLEKIRIIEMNQNPHHYLTRTGARSTMGVHDRRSWTRSALLPQSIAQQQSARHTAGRMDGAGSFGAGRTGSAFDLIAFIKQPQTVLRVLAWVRTAIFYELWLTEWCFCSHFNGRAVILTRVIFHLALYIFYFVYLQCLKGVCNHLT